MGVGFSNHITGINQSTGNGIVANVTAGLNETEIRSWFRNKRVFILFSFLPFFGYTVAETSSAHSTLPKPSQAILKYSRFTDEIKGK